MIGGFSIGKILVVLLIAFLLFGAKKLPDLGAGLGKAIKNFKKETSGLMEALKGKAGK